jgi:hypothetical protein
VGIITSIVITIALAAPMASIYFRRSTAIASTAAFILALAVCDDSTRILAMLALLFVILSVDVAEPAEGDIEGQQAMLDDDGRTFAEIADERASD